MAGNKNVVSGVYMITCKENGKIYFGSSNNIKRRWYEHIYKLRNGSTGFNQKMKMDFDKFGEKAFTFELIKELPKSKALLLEAYLIQTFETFISKNGYNISKGFIDII